jgi:hypothetical protein
MNYEYFNQLFKNERGNFKKLWKDETNRRFKKCLSKTGRWGLCEKNGKYGIINEDGSWSWMNRINTHPNCVKSFYEWCIKHDEKFFFYFGDYLYHRHNITKIWDYLESNFDLFFTKKITDKYYNEIEIKCKNSWLYGNLTVLTILFDLKKSFGEIKEVSFSLEEGDVKDMIEGVDLSFIDVNGEEKTIQVKSGTITNLGDEFLISGSPNDLRYKTDYYAYSSLKNNITDVIIFKNDLNKIKKENGNISIKKEIIIYYKSETMTESNKIREILIICGRNKIGMDLTNNKDHQNYVNIDINNNKVEINISDFEDENLKNILDEKILELNQIFQN